jgi:hypothetical protein
MPDGQSLRPKSGVITPGADSDSPPSDELSELLELPELEDPLVLTSEEPPIATPFLD